MFVSTHKDSCKVLQTKENGSSLTFMSRKVKDFRAKSIFSFIQFFPFSSQCLKTKLVIRVEKGGADRGSRHKTVESQWGSWESLSAGCFDFILSFVAAARKMLQVLDVVELDWWMDQCTVVCCLKECSHYDLNINVPNSVQHCLSSG